MSATTASSRGATPSAPSAAAETSAPEFDDAALADWLRTRIPDGGALAQRADRSIGIDHTARSAQTLADLADRYLELTTYYLADDLAHAIAEANELASKEIAQGTKVAIPGVVRAIPKNPADTRLGWPDDKVLRGLHLRGQVAASRNFSQVLDQMSRRGMNLIVLDVKDADGHITFPSKVPLANEIGAVQNPSMKHLSRVIQFAHDRGIRVAMRIVCFSDLLLSRVRGDLAVQSIRKQPLRIGWLDPANDTVQSYVLDLATEAMDAGADEIQMDYVRYPVEKVDNADFHLKERGLRRTHVIADFVHRMHERTKARGVSLSVDIFGIVAEGYRTDLENLGQDPALLARECEALAPMVYPSHYPKGFMGFDEPGDHPELVRVGVSKLLAQIRRVRGKDMALVRPWIQGMPYHAPSFGPQYIAQEMSHAKKAGAYGWMVWNPSQNFSDTWQAVAAPSASVADGVDR